MLTYLFNKPVNTANITLIILRCYLNSNYFQNLSDNHFPADTPDSVVEIMADYLELPYFGGIGYMRTDTCTVIVITDTYYAQRLGSIFRQLARP